MARSRNSNKDFEARYFDTLDENFRDIKADIKEVKDETKTITGHVVKINGRLTKVENKVFPAKKETVKQLPPIWRDPQVIKLLTYIVIAITVLLIIYAGLKGISLPKGLQ